MTWSLLRPHAEQLVEAELDALRRGDEWLEVLRPQSAADLVRSLPSFIN